MSSIAYPSKEEIEKINQLPIFFIIGRPRSGTTLLKVLFDAHPNIIVPNEFPVIIDLSYKYAKVTHWNAEILKSFYYDIFRVKKIEYNVINKEDLLHDLMKSEGENIYSDIIKILYSNVKSDFIKKEILCYGDKNPSYSMYVKELSKLFPDAKFIHIIRDYRDQISSMIKKELYDIPSVSILAYQWKRSLRMIRKVKRAFPEKFYTIKYKEFVENPKPLLKEMYDFINIPFDESVFNYYQNEALFKTAEKHDRIKTIQDNIFNPINTKRLYAWKDEMDAKSVKIADITVGKYAEMYGYERVYKSNFSIYFFPISFIKIFSLIQYFLRKRINTIPLEKRYKIRDKKSVLLRIYYSIFKNI
jgi:hypothetical protein